MPLRLKTTAGLAELEIDIPPVNVLGLAALEEFTRLVLQAGSERVLLLRGLPRAFSAGFSIAEHVPDPDSIEAMLAAMRGALNALVKTPAVTIAA
ncbi:MAG TPA: hypothetical protein VK389_00765, partial [Thermoanaerobaculia bacterium]|nr:hypothetical protein [Thermoanaerobaculia bacterium]